MFAKPPRYSNLRIPETQLDYRPDQRPFLRRLVVSTIENRFFTSCHTRDYNLIVCNTNESGEVYLPDNYLGGPEAHLARNDIPICYLNVRCQADAYP